MIYLEDFIRANRFLPQSVSEDSAWLMLSVAGAIVVQLVVFFYSGPKLPPH